MVNVYLYAVSYDLGFAPNPFGGLCSLACCKPNIRDRAKLGDWVIGLTGTKLKPPLRCVFAMSVTGTTTFDGYWSGEAFASRKARRNGTPKKQVGDNIYHRDGTDAPWVQEDSVHSLPGGAQCPLNTAHDTRVNRILLSEHFVYFGETAPAVPAPILRRLGYHSNARDYRIFDDVAAADLITWAEGQVARHPNAVLGDPFDFGSTAKTFSATRQRLV